MYGHTSGGKAMKSHYVKLIAVFFFVIVFALSAIIVYAAPGFGGRGMGGARMGSFGSEGMRGSMGGMRGGWSDIGSGSSRMMAPQSISPAPRVMGGDRSFGQTRAFGGHDFGDRDFGRHHGDRDRDFVILPFGLFDDFGFYDFYDGPYYYGYPYYGDSYNGYVNPHPAELGQNIVAQWTKSHTIQVIWTGDSNALTNLEVSILNGSHDSLVTQIATSRPFITSIGVPRHAIYVKVRAIGTNGVLLSDVTAKLPSK
jgi:hypothetical protein